MTVLSVWQRVVRVEIFELMVASLRKQGVTIGRDLLEWFGGPGEKGMKEMALVPFYTPNGEEEVRLLQRQPEMGTPNELAAFLCAGLEGLPSPILVVGGGA